jgi:hypothetical protein
MRSFAIIIWTAFLSVSSALAGNPVWTTEVRVDGIFGGDSQGRIRDIVEMLKAGDQKIGDVKVLAQNGYGKILRAAVLHSCSFPIDQAVLDETSVLRVSIDGIWGGSSTGRIISQIQTLKAAEQKIVRVEITSYNGYGKILGANIHHISKYKYESLTGSR